MKDLPHPLYQTFRKWSSELHDLLEDSSNDGGGNADTTSMVRETRISRLVATLFPFPYRVVRGLIRDSEGNQSANCDVVLLNPNHPNTMEKSDFPKFILADGVEAAIEVKTNPGKQKEIDEFQKQCKKTKSLNSLRSRLRLLKSHPKELENIGKKIPYFVYFLQAPSNIENVKKKIQELYNQHPNDELPDIICINNTGIFVNVLFDTQYQFTKSGLYFESWKDLTTAGFILYLNMIPSASLRAEDPFLPGYLLPLRAQTQFEEIELG